MASIVTNGYFQGIILNSNPGPLSLIARFCEWFGLMVCRSRQIETLESFGGDNHTRTGGQSGMENAPELSQ